LAKIGHSLTSDSVLVLMPDKRLSMTGDRDRSAGMVEAGQIGLVLWCQLLVAFEFAADMVTALDPVRNVHGALMGASCMLGCGVEIGDCRRVRCQLDASVIGNCVVQRARCVGDRLTGHGAEFVGQGGLAVIEPFEHGPIGSCCFGGSIGQQAGRIIEDLGGEQRAK
jgi:hypothetical protein